MIDISHISSNIHSIVYTPRLFSAPSTYCGKYKTSKDFFIFNVENQTVTLPFYNISPPRNVDIPAVNSSRLMVPDPNRSRFSFIPPPPPPGPHHFLLSPIPALFLHRTVHTHTYNCVCYHIVPMSFFIVNTTDSPQPRLCPPSPAGSTFPGPLAAEDRVPIALVMDDKVATHTLASRRLLSSGLPPAARKMHSCS